MEVANELMVRGVVVGVFQENCWVIGSRRTREAIVIDPGDEPETILALARDMGLNVKQIICSHAHVDHIMGVRGVQEQTGAGFLLLAAAPRPVVASASGVPHWLLVDPGANLVTTPVTANHFGFTQVGAPLHAGVAPGTTSYAQFAWFDACASGGIAASNAIEIAIQP